MLRITSIILLISLCTLTALNAQKKVAKWGDISPEHLQMTTCSLDSTAKAVVLQDVGNMHVFIDDSRGPGMLLMRQKRIKILHKDALTEGNLTINYYPNSQRITELRALVTTPGGVQTKVSSDNFFTEKVTDTRSIKKIFVPNVQVGSVIELGYFLQDDGVFSPDAWYFQSDLPTLHSHLEFEYPDLYSYVVVRNFAKAPSIEKANVTNFEYGRGYGQAKLAKAEVAFEDMPAVKDEPYMTTIYDHLASVTYQLQSYRNNLGIFTPVFSDWSTTVKDVLDNQSFGHQIEKDRPHKDISKAWAAVAPTTGTPEEKALAAHQFISKQIKWNGNFRLSVTDKNLDDAFEKKTGSSADLNLALIALMRDMGLDAYPICISTRRHGSHVEIYPIISQFNSVVAGLVIGDKLTIFDATSPYHAPQTMHPQHANYIGWMARKGNPIWIDVKQPTFGETILVTGTLMPDLSLEADVALRLSGNAATDFKDSYADAPNGAFIKSRYKDAFADMTMTDLKVEAKDPTKAAQITFKGNFKQVAQQTGDIIAVPLMIEKFFNENPFKSLTRTYPVQFPFPIKQEYILNLTTPEGYVIDYIPDATKLVMSEGGPQLLITAQKQSETQAQVRLTFTMKELIYVPEAYEGLRNFFTGLMEKQDQQIVLKKKS